MNTEPRSFKDVTTFQTGGRFSALIDVHTLAEAGQVVCDFEQKNKTFLFLGSGSNIVAPDEDSDISVVRLQGKKVSVEKNGDTILVTAEAGVLWDELVAMTVSEGWWGLENLSGIPGTVGASPIQNIGAYGSEVGDVIQKVEVYDRKEKRARTLFAHELAFSYRTSVFKKDPNRFVVWSVTFTLHTRGTPRISYKDLALHFGTHLPTQQEVRDAVIAIRETKFPSLSEYGCAGSFFLNPVISRTEADDLKAQYPELPTFETAQGVKISLAWVLDHLVLAKGMEVGGAFVWDKQPLVIATRRGATSRDIVLLAKKLMTRVREVTQLTIIPEVRILEKTFYEVRREYAA